MSSRLAQLEEEKIFLNISIVNKEKVKKKFLKINVILSFFLNALTQKEIKEAFERLNDLKSLF